MIEQYPTRKHREYRRDLPFGLSSSFIVHAGIILFLFSLATVYVVTETPATEQVKSQIITIETLVRTPHTAQVPQVVRQPAVSAEVTQPKPLHLTEPITAVRSHRDVAAPGLPAATAAHLARTRFVEQIRTAAAPKVNTGTIAAQPTTTGNTAVGNPGDGSSPGNYDKPISSTGGAWNEHAPGGPLGGGGDSGGSFGGITIGHGHDDCTPGRGGFLNGQ